MEEKILTIEDVSRRLDEPEPEPDPETRCDLRPIPGIELVGLGDSRACTVCAAPAGPGFAGFLAYPGDARERVCDRCLFAASAPLGILAAAAAFLRGFARLESPAETARAVPELFGFATVFDRLLEKTFGPPRRSELLDLLLKSGGDA